VIIVSLSWLQNGQGWGQLAGYPFALEIFPDENVESNKPQACVDHAFSEIGPAAMVTLCYKTKPPNVPAQYDLTLTHSLYTADDVTPVTQEGWAAWKGPKELKPPMPTSAPVTTPWYQKPYPKNHAPPQVQFPGPLYPPDSVSAGKRPSANSPFVVAVKRAVSRGGRWPWQQFDDIYSNAFSHGNSGNVSKTGVAGVQRQSGIDPTGWLGASTFEVLRTSLVPKGLPNEGQPLFDKIALDLIAQANQPTETPADKAVKYMQEAEAHEPVWHYTQARPYTGVGVAPDQPHWNDCSGYAILIYDWAGWPDPAHENFNGEGNTSYLANNTHVSGNYEVGDLAFYGDSWFSTDHVTICKKGGDALTSLWSSHGQEGGPQERKLIYREPNDFLGVTRPGKA
jgi:hypothetical protein